MISRVTHRSVVNIQEYTLCVFAIKKAAWPRGKQTRNADSSCLNAVYFLSLSLVQCVRFGAGSLKKEERSFCVILLMYVRVLQSKQVTRYFRSSSGDNIGGGGSATRLRRSDVFHQV